MYFLYGLKDETSSNLFNLDAIKCTKIVDKGPLIIGIAPSIQDDRFENIKKEKIVRLCATEIHVYLVKIVRKSKDSFF